MAPAHCTGRQNKKARVQATDVFYSPPGGTPMPALAWLSIIISSSTLAQAPPARSVLIRAARLFDGRGEATTSPALVVVRGGKIAAVGKLAAPPSEAETIDLGDATLLPGLIDAHTHLTEEASSDWKKDELDRFKKPIAQFAVESVEYARRTLLAGFTTVRDVGSRDLLDVGLRNAIAEGKAIGPRMLVSVKAIGSRGGHCDPTAGYRPDEGRRHLPERCANIASDGERHSVTWITAPRRPAGTSEGPIPKQLRLCEVGRRGAANAFSRAQSGQMQDLSRRLRANAKGGAHRSDQA